ncbi:ATP-dependent helicase [Flectobacillus major]|uniref:ATP-dependent helicase n=1 Tax=Flectobacillus major TaxID=103 RepID=UPI00041824EA|nr:UvrD-helicase domain-containing protein [Flectobacillus major]
MEHLKGLNTQQLQAVKETEGYVRVIAGAGSGKTKTLVSRYVHLVKDLGVNPSNILCVTFTNNASREMRNRIKAQLEGLNLSEGYITTYHGFCVKVLREDIYKLQIPQSFTILDSEDQKTILRQIYEELNITSREYTFKDIIRRISERKQDISYIEEYFSVDSANHYEDSLSSNDSLLDTIFKRYLFKQLRNFSLDFDDLMNFTIYLFMRYEELLKKWQKRLQYIQVDEVQDSSAKQFMFVQLLANYHKNLFVVGDPDQTIYEWRGAKPELLVEFDKLFKDSKTIILNQNYRSTPQILKVSNSIIKNNTLRVEKEMVTQLPDGKEVVYYHAQSNLDESKWIVNEILRRSKEKNCSFNDFTILYRSSYLTRVLEQALIMENIPYSIHGGIRFFERKEIKDIIAYLRLIAFNDNTAFLRIVNVPSRKLGKKFVTDIVRLSEEANQPIFSTLEQNLSKFKQKGAKEFVELIQGLRRLKTSKGLSDFVKYLFDKSGLSLLYRNDGDYERLENIAEFQNSLITIEKTSDEVVELEDYLQEISLYNEMSKDEEQKHNKVKLMTIHSAKGLEFKNVFLCGFIDGVLPSQRAINDRGVRALEEERRLTYVAMTRAMESLYISDYEGYNYTNDSENQPSRFYFEIDNSLLKREGYINSPVFDTKNITSLNKRLLPDTPKSILRVGDFVFHIRWNKGQVIDVDKSSRIYQILFPEFNIIRNIHFDFDGIEPFK